LEQQREVDVGLHGRVRHLPWCDTTHALADDRLGLLMLSRQWVRARVLVPEPPANPGIWCLDPPIDGIATPEFPHLLSDGSACVMWSPDRAWDAARRDSLVDFLRVAMLWVLKAMIWLDTRWGRQYGVWVGPTRPVIPARIWSRSDPTINAPADPAYRSVDATGRRCCSPRWT
jgi:hypothetical protein